MRVAAPFVSLLTPYSLYRVPLLRIQEIRISHAGIWGGGRVVARISSNGDAEYFGS